MKVYLASARIMDLLPHLDHNVCIIFLHFFIYRLLPFYPDLATLIINNCYASKKVNAFPRTHLFEHWHPHVRLLSKYFLSRMYSVATRSSAFTDPLELNEDEHAVIKRLQKDVNRQINHLQLTLKNYPKYSAKKLLSLYDHYCFMPTVRNPTTTQEHYLELLSDQKAFRKLYIKPRKSNTLSEL